MKTRQCNLMPSYGLSNRCAISYTRVTDLPFFVSYCNLKVCYFIDWNL